MVGGPKKGQTYAELYPEMLQESFNKVWRNLQDKENLNDLEDEKND